MKFINLGEPIKIRIGKSGNCYWNTIRKNEIVDVSFKRGNSLGLTKLKTTEGQIGDKKVETKQIDNKKKDKEILDNYSLDDLFFKELTKIKGIGIKTAKDIVVWGTKEKLIEAIKLKAELPFRDDVDVKLRKEYGN